MIIPVFWMCWWLGCTVVAERTWEDLLEVYQWSLETAA